MLEQLFQFVKRDFNLIINYLSVSIMMVQTNEIHFKIQFEQLRINLVV